MTESQSLVGRRFRLETGAEIQILFQFPGRETPEAYRRYSEFGDRYEGAVVYRYLRSGKEARCSWNWFVERLGAGKISEVAL